MLEFSKSNLLSTGGRHNPCSASGHRSDINETVGLKVLWRLTYAVHTLQMAVLLSKWGRSPRASGIGHKIGFTDSDQVSSSHCGCRLKMSQNCNEIFLLISRVRLSKSGLF